jgi:hypothetical protein
MKVVCGIDFATPQHVRNMVHPRLVALQFATLVCIRLIDFDGYSSLPVSQVGFAASTMCLVESSHGCLPHLASLSSPYWIEIHDRLAVIAIEVLVRQPHAWQAASMNDA